MTPAATIRKKDESKRSHVIVTARQAAITDTKCIAGLLAFGIHPAQVTPEQVSGTLQAGAHCYLLYLDGELLGLVELRAVHLEPERSDAAVVIWLVTHRPIGIGAVTLGFILRYAFCTLGLREVWGWVRNDNHPMLALCRRLGIIDNRIWTGDPDFRLMTCTSGHFDVISQRIERLNDRIVMKSDGLSAAHTPSPMNH